ncbi:predicted protein [Plenodomus lingam JN3]|uniref:Predicted protein n=1 Tax=Leptosphaeria maculans (strain JN3 / isolate v23.1.3 / race Av1-4-5-6-7-8) TaxID=985895 RepID=E4ZQN5_LEPMJ|nr:predicted protein [Plenodomus lingam JN3]CBX94040.1 predicted protein [Plenodomus lingam JN3]
MSWKRSKREKDHAQRKDTQFVMLIGSYNFGMFDIH